MDMPSKLHLGSGKDFKKDYINVDVNPEWNPDIVYDLNEQFPHHPAHQFMIKRFDERITISVNTFDEIVSNDTAEHINEIITFMTSCRDLLKVGGMLKLSVPYELGDGAWSDPTHVRTFNERSWIYYCDWYWYLGWTDYKFKVSQLLFNYSKYGKSLADSGSNINQILKVPRAIDSMQVWLEKVEVTDREKELVQEMKERNPNA